MFFHPHDFIASLVIRLVMYLENPDLLKSEATLNHMVPNEHSAYLCMNEVFWWVNMSQEDLFLEKKKCPC